ncbi:50S ribosome-binding GTPase [Candidatus Micrarchaeota archaeon]|nr:50S ribosome-binding GTPase [Candidatus Micrarchaeota archaeon]
MASLNAGPEYYSAEGRYQSAKTRENKLLALKDMLKFAPKHKGSQSILMEIKKKISALRDEEKIEKKKKAGKKGSGDFIKKQGAAQISIVGIVNSGKSCLFNRLCNLKTPSSEVQFETQEAVPGMMDYEKIQFQFLDLPSITDQNKAKYFAVARMSDLCIVVLDPLQDLYPQKKFFEELAAKKMYLVSKKAILAVEYGDPQYDAYSDEDLEFIKKAIKSNLNLIRIYTKSPRGEIDKDKPFVMLYGSNVSDIAKQIHKDLYTNLKYARVWGSAKFSGQQVSGDFILKDGDVVELHMK